ncbi:MAG: 5-dehydro-4-deoxy-D-glucuronate isomerase [Chthoniobacterales bacterium]
MPPHHIPTLHAIPGARETAALDTAGLRANFLLTDLFAPGELRLALTDLDRAAVGSACPKAGAPLRLETPAEFRSDYFCERRELGVINLGGAGEVTVDSEVFSLAARECLYVGRGAREIEFRSGDGAAFYLVSYPAHATHPTRKAEASVVKLGSPAEANERTLYQFIHEGGTRSCQLVMGYTELSPGSVWNTMPPHTHLRRTEVYCYFDVPDAHAVLHVMGEPQNTRSLWVANHQAVLSPAWSVHCGAGTSNYRFVWAMGGENQRFDDMDKIAISELR